MSHAPEVHQRRAEAAGRRHVAAQGVQNHHCGLEVVGKNDEISWKSSNIIQNSYKSHIIISNLIEIHSISYHLYAMYPSKFLWNPQIPIILCSMVSMA
jgi:hypothetical protein